MSDNPFNYSEPVARGDLIDRDPEAARLLDRALGGHNSRLVAPRRFGKTSLLNRVGHEADRHGWSTVYVNLFGVISPDDIAQRIERAYAEQLQGRLGAWFAGARRILRPTVRAGGGPVPASAEVTLDASAERPLLERLALPAKLHQQRGVRTLVVFDEFQDLLSAGRQIDAVIRSEIEHHGDAASYIFAGSQMGMMRELFADKRRAFYGQAGPVDLGPLAPDDVAVHLDERFRATGRDVGEALDPLLEVAQGHPQRTMLLAHFLWNATPRGATATAETWVGALDRVLDVEIRDELRAIWNGLSTPQRRALVAVAENASPLYSRSSQREHASSRGGGLRAAVRALVDRGEVVEDSSAVTRHRVVDPLLAHWVRAGRNGE